jgi:hypothetical protein
MEQELTGIGRTFIMCIKNCDLAGNYGEKEREWFGGANP